MREVLDDLRYAGRQLRRTPTFTAVAVLTLALGIGANTAFYSIIDATFWRPLRIVDLSGVHDVSVMRPPKQYVPGTPWERQQLWYPLTPAQLAHIAAEPALGVIATAEISQRGVTVQTPLGAYRTSIDLVRGDHAGVFRMRPLLGSIGGLREDDTVGTPTVVITDALWRRFFHGDPAIVGRDSIRISGRTFIVAGVVARDFAIHDNDLWASARIWRETMNEGRGQGLSFVRFGRDLAPARLRSLIDASLANGPTPPEKDYKATLSMYISRTGLSRAVSSSYTWMILGLSSLVLLAACANLANMLYARAAQRTGEIAVRVSLGAGAGRIFRLFLLEASIIAAAAAAIGLGMAMVALRSIDSASAAIGSSADRFDIASMPPMSPDWRTFAAAILAGGAAAVIVGGVTAWRGSRTPPLRMFGAGGVAMTTPARGKWMRTLLVAVQVSAAVVLLLGTGLYLVRAFTQPRLTVNYDTGPLATARLTFDGTYRDYQVVDVMTDVLARVKTIDGVERAAIADGLIGATYAGGKSLQNLIAEDESMPGQMSGWRRLEGQQAAVSPELLETIGLRVIQGRGLNDNDREGAPAAVLLSNSAVQSVWPGLDPIGRRVRLGSDPRWFTVVGVFDDPARRSSDTKWKCTSCVAFTSWRQKPSDEWLVVLRASAPAAAAEQIVRTVASVNEAIPVLNPAAADASVFRRTRPDDLFASMMGGLGLLSLAIAALGVYGVISYSVSRRTREFGIRLALGATPRGILRAVLDDAIHLVLVGLLPGVLLASWGTRVLEGSLVRLMPNDIPTWAAVPILVLVIGLFAAYVPARRAARVDPNVALRDL